MRRIGKRFLAGGLAVSLLLAGCTSQQPAPAPATSSTSLSPSPSTPTSQSPSTPGPRPSGSYSAPSASGPAAGSSGLDHVVIILLENKPASEILQVSDAPYLNKLATDYALAADYHAVTHPSLPNYIALTSGTTAGITDNCRPSDCSANVRNIGDAVAESGRTWKMYAEGMPGPCQADNTGNYAVKHNPFMYYPSVTGDPGSCAAHVVPFSQLDQDLGSASSLPNYVFITPDLCSDTHNCPVQTGDEWLSREAGKILGSPAFTSQKSLLVVTWDEGSKNNNQVVTVFAGPAAKQGYTSTNRYTHYSLLHTIENAWGLQPLTGNDRDAPLMNDLLK